MAMEIERKFRVVSDAWRAQVNRSLAMRQGYLAGEGGKASVRVRLEGEDAKLNIKAAVVGAARAEYEYDIPAAQAREMLDNLCIGRLEKTRHYIEIDGLTWEVDEFINDNAGLVVAEIELDSIDQPFERPAWLGRELTEDRRYYNHHLALHPWRTWPDEDRH
ncbi:CYTH domain protein [Solimonas fluminis]|uniref:CYTH domain protein n=1 Tax=Solimonas fluminis TaxID=2086571 RepID=A0A2S5TLH6_9GAMM|nr:CYTH domain-containing protein [Solimonas fluminis]PPE75821.1 CYTH domain protein [Solimonas fluminis]